MCEGGGCGEVLWGERRVRGRRSGLVVMGKEGVKGGGVKREGQGCWSKRVELGRWSWMEMGFV